MDLIPWTVAETPSGCSLASQPEHLWLQSFGDACRYSFAEKAGLRAGVRNTQMSAPLEILVLSSEVVADFHLMTVGRRLCSGVVSVQSFGISLCLDLR